MKLFILMAILIIPSVRVEARDPGTGSNTTVSEGAGPATPDAAPGATSVMGGGTPGNEGIDKKSIYDTVKEYEKMEQEDKNQEEEENQSTRE